MYMYVYNKLNKLTLKLLNVKVLEKETNRSTGKIMSNVLQP